MSNIDALLDGETNNKVTLTVNEPNRSMTYDGQILLGVEGDHKAERIYFKAPRHIFMDKDVDLSSENINIYINFKNASNNTYIYECDDKTSDEEYVYFSWVLTKTVAEMAGKVSFTICVKNIGTDENGAEVIRNEWHSTPFTGEVQKGIPVDSATPEIITDPQTSIYQLKLEIQSVDLIVKQHADTIATLSEAVNNKVDKTDLTALETAVNNKADKTELTALETAINNKADKTELTALKSAMDSKVNRSELELFEDVVTGKAEQSDLDNLEGRVATLEAGSDSGEGEDNPVLLERLAAAEQEITNLQGDINTLETVVNGKASQTSVDAKANKTDLDALEVRVETLEAGEGSGSGSSGGSGESVDLTEVNETLADHETRISNVETNKAAKSDVDNLKTRVTTLEGSGATATDDGEGNVVINIQNGNSGSGSGEGGSVDLTEVNNALADHETRISNVETTKAAQSDVTTLKTDVNTLKLDVTGLKTRVSDLEAGNNSGSSSGENTSTDQNVILEFGYDFPASQDSTTNYIIDLSELPEEQLKNANTIMIHASEADIYLNKVAAVSGSMYVYTACEYIRTSSSAYPKVYSCVFDITDEIEVILSIYNMNFASQISTLETKVENIDISDLESRVEDIETSDLESRVVNLEAEHTISFTLHDINGDNQDVTLSTPFRTQWSSLATSNPQIMIDQDGLMCYGSTSRPLFKDSSMIEYVYKTDYVEKNKVYYYGG